MVEDTMTGFLLSDLVVREIEIKNIALHNYCAAGPLSDVIMVRGILYRYHAIEPRVNEKLRIGLEVSGECRKPRLVPWT